MSDNYHQAVNGGTGANHIMLGTGDAIWFSDGNGNPPCRRTIRSSPHPGTANRLASALSEIENPNPLSSTNNWYTQDGYGGGSVADRSSPTPITAAASYSDCADTTQPGVAADRELPHTLPKVNPNCQSGPLLSPQQLQSGLFRRRHQRLYDTNSAQLRVHGSAVERAQHWRCAQRRRGSPWAYFGDQFNRYLNDKY